MTRKGGEHHFGVVFSIDTSGNNYTVLHDFAGGDSDGATSDHGYVVQSGHHLYGMTTNGGHHDDGVIFKLNIDDQSSTCFMGLVKPITMAKSLWLASTGGRQALRHDRQRR
jgi:uncharacterized repeat protein (TIGR03803 family)